MNCRRCEKKLEVRDIVSFGGSLCEDCWIGTPSTTGASAWWSGNVSGHAGDIENKRPSKGHNPMPRNVKSRQ